jgi:hypothetical protein
VSHAPWASWAGTAHTRQSKHIHSGLKEIIRKKKELGKTNRECFECESGNLHTVQIEDQKHAEIRENELPKAGLQDPQFSGNEIIRWIYGETNITTYLLQTENISSCCAWTGVLDMVRTDDLCGLELHHPLRRI